MARQAIMGTYVLHEQTFACQAEDLTDEERHGAETMRCITAERWRDD
jgi:hypothetical protein